MVSSDSVAIIFGRFSIPRSLWIVLAAVWLTAPGIALGICPQARAGDRLRPKLLDGAVCWVGNPVASKTKTVPRECIKCLAFSADGKRLLIGKDNGLIATVGAQHGRLLDSLADGSHKAPFSLDLSIRPV